MQPNIKIKISCFQSLPIALLQGCEVDLVSKLTLVKIIFVKNQESTMKLHHIPHIGGRCHFRLD